MHTNPHLGIALHRIRESEAHAAAVAHRTAPARRFTRLGRTRTTVTPPATTAVTAGRAEGCPAA